MPKLHPFCRPPRGAINVLRLGSDGKWREDNGAIAHAFIGQFKTSTTGSAIVWVADCACPYTKGCPLGKALDEAANRGAEGTEVQRRRREYPPRKKRKTKR